MITVNLKDYPVFWSEVVSRLREVLEPGSLLTREAFIRITKEEYHLSLTINRGDPIGVVHFNNDIDYMFFSLRWGFHGG